LLQLLQLLQLLCCQHWVIPAHFLVQDMLYCRVQGSKKLLITCRSSSAACEISCHLLRCPVGCLQQAAAAAANCLKNIKEHVLVVNASRFRAPDKEHTAIAITTLIARNCRRHQFRALLHVADMLTSRRKGRHRQSRDLVTSLRQLLQEACNAVQQVCWCSWPRLLWLLLLSA